MPVTMAAMIVTPAVYSNAWVCLASPLGDQPIGRKTHERTDRQQIAEQSMVLRGARSEHGDGHTPHGDDDPKDVPAPEALVEHLARRDQHQRGLEGADHRDVDDARQAHRAVKHHHVAREEDATEPGMAQRRPAEALTHGVGDDREERCAEPESIEGRDHPRREGQGGEDPAERPERRGERRGTEAKGRASSDVANEASREQWRRALRATLGLLAFRLRSIGGR